MRNYDDNAEMSTVMRNYDDNAEMSTPSQLTRNSEEKEYIRPKIDYLREHEISIRFLSLGCIVRVGCKEIAFTSIDEAIQEVNDYVANPKLLTDKYNKIFNEE
jgi:hypothetical protein